MFKFLFGYEFNIAWCGFFSAYDLLFVTYGLLNNRSWKYCLFMSVISIWMLSLLILWVIRYYEELETVNDTRICN